MNPPQLPNLLTAEQLAARWQVPPSQVYRLTRNGDLDGMAVKLGRYYRYAIVAIEHFEATGGATTNPETTTRK
jgi:hypothetical protein